jgi:two-component system, cell cycle sensor histidine kinase and response regulator CckA
MDMTKQLATKTAKANDGDESMPDSGNLSSINKAGLVGQLANAMANHFNNIMMALTGYADLELKQATPARKRNLEQILAHSARATFLIQKFLALTSAQPLVPRQFALNDVIKEISRLLQPLAGEEIQVNLKLNTRVSAIFADPLEVEQIILGLCLYIRDFSRQCGAITISTELVNLDPSFGSELSKPGEYAHISLQYAPNLQPSSKTRNPIAVENRDLKLLQTLASLTDVVNRRSGHLRISTSSEQRFTCDVYFPSLPLPETNSETTASPDTVPCTKTVLIVEDDDFVRVPAAEFLMMEGFKVLQARNGMEALRIVQDTRSHVDLLITDIMMAGMNGNQLAEHLLKYHEELKVLYISGDVEMVHQVGGSGSSTSVVLQKPFRLQHLSEKMRELLSE